MIPFVISYLFGTAISEGIFLGLWFRTAPARAPLSEFWWAKRSDIVLSATMGLGTCVLWGEGTLLKMIVDWKELDLTQTLGLSIAAGAVVGVFARVILRLVGKFVGADEKGD